MRHIGDTLLIQYKMVGRVEASEKSEVLWNRLEISRLYAYLSLRVEWYIVILIVAEILLSLYAMFFKK